MATPRKFLALAVVALAWPSPWVRSAEPTLREVARELARLREENAAMRRETAAMQREIARLKAAVAPQAKPAAEAAAPVALGAKADATTALGLTEAQIRQAKFEQLSEFFTVPDSPAAAVLGIAPEKVIHAGTPKQLATTLINGLDQDGHFQTGFALDFAPTQLFLHKELRRELPVSERTGFFRGDIGRYYRSVLDRTQLSFATTRGTEAEDKSSKLALGINIPLLDADDPTVGDAVDQVKLNDLASAATRRWAERLNARFERDGVNPFVNGPLAGLLNTMYHHTSWSIGGAARWIAPEDDRSAYEYAGATVWSTMTFSLDHERKAPMRLLLHARYDDAQQIASADAIHPPVAALDPVTGLPGPVPDFIEQDTLLMVAGLKFGRRDFSATASAAYVKRWQRSGVRGSEDSFIYSISAEKRIGNGPIWLTLSAGQEIGETRDSETIVLGGFRLGLDGNDWRLTNQ